MIFMKGFLENHIFNLIYSKTNYKNIIENYINFYSWSNHHSLTFQIKVTHIFCFAHPVSAFIFASRRTVDAIWKITPSYNIISDLSFYIIHVANPRWILEGPLLLSLINWKDKIFVTRRFRHHIKWYGSNIGHQQI